MDMPDPSVPPHGGLPRLANVIIGADDETLRKTSAQDINTLRMFAWLTFMNGGLEALALTVAGERAFAPPGTFRPEIALGAVFIAVYVVVIDVLLFVRSGFYADGLAELKRVGLDISGGVSAKLGAAVSLIIRFMLAASFSQINALVIATILFSAGIQNHNVRAFQDANPTQIAQATALEDTKINRARNEVAAHEDRVAGLARQIHDLRATAIDDPRVNAELEVEQLLRRQTQAQDAVRDKESAAAAEMSGKSASGRPGRGIRYQAAIDEVTAARRYAQELAAAVNAARARLDAMRGQAAPADDATRQHSIEQLANFEKTLAAESTQLAILKNELNTLIAGRENAIRKAVTNAPNAIPLETGLLADIGALREIAEERPEAKYFILLLDAVAFALEMGLVLAKLMGTKATSYAVQLPRNAFMEASKVADEISGAPAPLKPNGIDPQGRPPHAANDNQPGFDFEPAFDTVKGPIEAPPQPPKRKRGRPRKHPHGLNGSSPAPKQSKNGKQQEESEG